MGFLFHWNAHFSPLSFSIAVCASGASQFLSRSRAGFPFRLLARVFEARCDGFFNITERVYMVQLSDSPGADSPLSGSLPFIMPIEALAKVRGPGRPHTDKTDKIVPEADLRRDNPAVIGRINPEPDHYPIRGEGAQLKLMKTTQGLIMRADHVVRDFLEDVHRELGEIVKAGSGEGAPIGYSGRTSPEIDLVRLGGLINRGELFLDSHSSARFDGMGPSLVVRNVASEGLKMFEHLKLALNELVREGRVAESSRPTVLAELVEMRGNLRSLVHHFDSRMLEFAATLQQKMAELGEGDGDSGPRAA